MKTPELVILILAIIVPLIAKALGDNLKKVIAPESQKRGHEVEVILPSGNTIIVEAKEDQPAKESAKESAHDVSSSEIAADNQREAALQAYLDNMSKLLLEQKLRDSAEEDERRKIARARTLMVLRGLDPIRKASVIQFLYDSDLLDKNKRIIGLSGADLSFANLHKADLRGADLHEADLHEADLSGTNLSKANLSGTNLSKANLSKANLHEADLSFAVLSFADLHEADLSGAHLEVALSLGNTDLRGVKGLTKEQLEACKAKGAIIDEDTTTSPPQSPVSPPASSQSNDAQAPSAPPAQVNTPTPDTDGSNATSSQSGATES